MSPARRPLETRQPAQELLRHGPLGVSQRPGSHGKEFEVQSAQWLPRRHPAPFSHHHELQPRGPGQEDFVGDRARRGAIFDHLEELREALRETGEDPIDVPSEELKKKDLDALLAGDDAEAAALQLREPISAIQPTPGADPIIR